MSSPPLPGSSTVEEVVRREVADWDDDAASRARFKAFSGQRPDWEPRYLFWRDLILKVARHLGLLAVRPSEVKNIWFARGGLTPICIHRVLQEMHDDGDILLRGELIDPTSGRLYQILRRVVHMAGLSKSSLQEDFEDSLILRPLLEERATEVMNAMVESNWSSTCIITMGKLRTICKGSDEAAMILSYLSECRKAQYFSIKKKDFVEGVKLSLVAGAVPSISSIDCDSLQLIWTTEKLQQQLDVIDQHWETSRKMALESLKSGNKQVAYRHIRKSKLLSESRVKCTSLLERVEEVLSVIAHAESTKKVSEAIQIGTRAIKENSLSAEEVYVHLQELDDSVAEQKQINEALESMPVQSMDFEDEDVEEEFKKLEMELTDEMPQPQRQKPVADGVHEVVGETSAQQNSAEFADLLTETLSKLNLEAA